MCNRYERRRRERDEGEKERVTCDIHRKVREKTCGHIKKIHNRVKKQHKRN